MQILVRYHKKEEWSQDNDDYSEISVSEFEKIENLIDPLDDSTVVKIQVFQRFGHLCFYLLAMLETQQDKGGQVKWLIHVHRLGGDDEEKILIFEKCKNFDPPAMERLSKLETECNEPVKSFLRYVEQFASLADDTETFAQEVVNRISGRIRWRKICRLKVQVADDDNATDQSKKIGNTGYSYTSTLLAVESPRTDRTPAAFKDRNLWKGTFIYQEGEYVNLFEGDIDKTSKFLTLLEVEKLLGTRSRIMNIFLCEVGIRDFSNGQITEQFTASSGLLMLKIKSSSEESNQDGTWWTFFLNGYQDTSRSEAFSWYVLLHKHSEVDTSTIKTKSQLVKIVVLKRDESLQCVGQLCTYLKEQYIPVYQKNHRPGDTYSFCQNVASFISNPTKPKV